MRENWEYRRGDLYLADLDPTKGAEIGGMRPVLVIQNNKGNHYAPTLIVAPLTSNIEKKPNQPTHFLLEQGNGLYKPSMVILEQIRTIDKCRIIRYMGRLEREVMDSSAFFHCLAASLSIDENQMHSLEVRKGADYDTGRNEKC